MNIGILGRYNLPERTKLIKEENLKLGELGGRSSTKREILIKWNKLIVFDIVYNVAPDTGLDKVLAV